MAGFSQHLVRLQRDALNTPWGFRLQGGLDVGQPLCVQRVFSGTAAEGDLQRGDIIAEIEHRRTDNCTHKEAQDVIKEAGGSILLTIKRPPAAKLSSPLSPNPRPVPLALRIEHPSNMQRQYNAGHKPTVQRQAYGGGPTPTFGVDYAKRGAAKSLMSPPVRSQDDHYMLNKVQQSLDHALLSPVGRYNPDLVDTSPQYIPQKQPVSLYQQQPEMYRQTSHEHDEPHRPFKQQSVPVQYQQPSPSYQQPSPSYQQPRQQQRPGHPQQQPRQYQQQVQVHTQQQSPGHYQQHSPGQYQQPSPIQYQQQSPVHFQPSFDQPRLVHNEEEEDDYEHLSVSERKKSFMKPDENRQHIQPSLKKPSRKLSPFTPQSRQPEFGINYARKEPQSAPIRQPVHHPFVQSTPPPPTYASPHTSADVVVPDQAWRGTLKKSGNKTWMNDVHLDECYQRPEPPPQPTPVKPKVRSVPIQQQSRYPVQSTPGSLRSIPVKKPESQHGRTRSVPVMTTWKREEVDDDGAKSPQVMNLQYNSPINMYSRENVHQTLVGQVGQAPTVVKPNVQKIPFGNEPRDWDQSAVYRMIHGVQRPQQNFQEGDHHFQNSSQTMDDEVGISDF